MATSKVTLFDSLTKELRCNDAGEGFTTWRGLGRMCGVDYQTFGRGDNIFGVKIDEYLMECGIDVTAFDLKKGIPDTIASMVIGFYAEEKQNPTAKKYSRAFRAYGLRKAIQDVTGYTSASKVYQITDILRRKPAAWELMFSSGWIAEAEKLTGWKWTYRCMGKFINDCVYTYLPAEVVDALKSLNPVAGNGNRAHKHHQFLQPEIRDMVSAHLQDVETLMKVSDGDMEFFRSLMIKKYGSFKLSGKDDMPLFKPQTVFLLKQG